MNQHTHSADLRARGLSKSFGHVRALAGVDIYIPGGQSVAVMGPSGSGKSTLLHCLAGILLPDNGEVRLGETIISDVPDTGRSALRRDQLGVVFQYGK